MEEHYDYNFVQSFKYLGKILNVENDIEDEIKTRLTPFQKQARKL